MHDNSNKNNNNNNDHKSNIGKQINRAAITGDVRADIPAKRLIKTSIQYIYDVKTMSVSLKILDGLLG